MPRKIKLLFNRFLNSRLLLPFFSLVMFLSVSAALVLAFEIREDGDFQDFIDALWWSIITFSTTGYGDKVPVTLGGRIVAIISIFIGIAAMSLLSGTLASLLVDRSAKARRGLMDYSKKIKDHFVLCGWKENMRDIITEILRINPRLNSDDMIIISNIAFERMEELKKEQRLAGLKYVKGDYFAESPLQRASVETARKVIILADSLESQAASEVDSKTVMTVLTIRAMSRDVYICAELLDNKFEHYLKQAMCDEIILSRDYARMILANSSATNGISHIIYQLISPTAESSKLTTCPIPGEFINRSYRDFRLHIDQSGDKLALGILENTGSPNKMKLNALREAQKTSDISTLVANLQAVKSLEVNNPVLLPGDSYMIRPHSMGIILEKTGDNPEAGSLAVGEQ